MHRSFIDRLLLPTIVGLTTVLAALLLCERLLTQQRAEIQATTKAHVLFVRNKMEAELKARVLPLERMARRWEIRGQPNDMDLESDATLVMIGYRGYQAIEWVDPTFHLRWVAPRRGNEADLGADLGSDARLRVALQAADDMQQVMVTRPLDLRQGGRGFAVCVPIFPKGNFGVLLGLIRYQEMLPSILEDVAQDYWVAVYDGDEQVYSRAGPSAPKEEAWAQETDIKFQQLTWRARVWPKPEALAYARSFLPQVALVGGILMAGLLAFAVYLAETSQLRAREVAATNKELKRQIAGREEAEEALRQAQKMEAVGRLAGGIAHDFNNLLMVIRGRAALSLNSLGLDSSLRRGLEEILKAADRASSSTRQLLAFSRKQVLQPRVLNLNTLVSQMAELLPPVLGEDINLVMDLDPRLGQVRADPGQMEQVTMNLVFNARDAMPDGGELTIQTRNADLDQTFAHRHAGVRAGPHVMLAVRDTGRGMDDEIQPHIFEPFFTTKDRSKGTGLGLATVYGTVTQSGGCVTVSSQLGQGTTIQIYLPRVEETIEVIETPKALPESLEGGETILVVEDDDAVRNMTREFLKIKGYTVVEAKSAAEAVQLLERHEGPIDLVLTDVVMPGMKGHELGQRLASLRPGMKVLYMSAYTEDAIVNYGILIPGTAFIEKPFSPDELAGKVREVLDAKRDNVGAEYLHHG
jgi:signal transduction histidine kinase/CheY-like chemotaxis protein